MPRPRLTHVVVALAVAVVLALGFLLLTTGGAVSAGRPGSNCCAPAASSAGAVYLYVASAGGAVTAYHADSSGAVSAVRTIANPNLNNTFWDPWGVTFDENRDLYVQGFLSDATTFVYPWGATKPSRIFHVIGPDSRSIAVDPNGYEYVASSEGPSTIAVAAPEANGKPSNLYSVASVRTITTAETLFAPWPSSQTINGSGDLVFAALRNDANAVETFAGGAVGSNTPLRYLAGALTTLGTCSGIDTCDYLAVARSAPAGELLVAVSPVGESGPTHLCVFAGSANGDTAPLRVISGTRTGLDNAVVTGLAVSATTGEIYALVKPAQFSGPASIEVFRAGATGDVAPIRSFTDAGNHFADALGIAVVTAP